jgi:acyl carrier protein
MEEKIKGVFNDVFDVSISEINDNSSPDNIEMWDSLYHTNLIIALEEAFSISFEPEEIIDMLNFKLIKLTIEEKVNSK